MSIFRPDESSIYLDQFIQYIRQKRETRMSRNTRKCKEIVLKKSGKAHQNQPSFKIGEYRKVFKIKPSEQLDMLQSVSEFPYNDEKP